MSVSPLIRYDRSYFLTRKHLPDNLAVPLRETVASIAREWPIAPRCQDRETKLEPLLIVWQRRRIAASSRWVHYPPTAEGLIIRSVNNLG